MRLMICFGISCIRRFDGQASAFLQETFTKWNKYQFRYLLRLKHKCNVNVHFNITIPDIRHYVGWQMSWNFTVFSFRFMYPFDSALPDNFSRSIISHDCKLANVLRSDKFLWAKFHFVTKMKSMWLCLLQADVSKQPLFIECFVYVRKLYAPAHRFFSHNVRLWRPLRSITEHYIRMKLSGTRGIRWTPLHFEECG